MLCGSCARGLALLPPNIEEVRRRLVEEQAGVSCASARGRASTWARARLEVLVDVLAFGAGEARRKPTDLTHGGRPTPHPPIAHPSCIAPTHLTATRKRRRTAQRPAAEWRDAPRLSSSRRGSRSGAGESLRANRRHGASVTARPVCRARTRLSLLGFGDPTPQPVLALPPALAPESDEHRAPRLVHPHVCQQQGHTEALEVRHELPCASAVHLSTVSTQEHANRRDGATCSGRHQAREHASSGLCLRRRRGAQHIVRTCLPPAPSSSTCVNSEKTV